MTKTFIGTLITKPTSVGSKLQHDAYFVSVGRDQYKVRVEGDDVYKNPTLAPLLGKKVKATYDVITDVGVYLLTAIEEVKPLEDSLSEG